MAAPSTTNATTAVDPSNAAATTPKEASPQDNNKYRTLVVDSGPIIKLTGISALNDRAHAFYTVPAVIAEIRDARARQHLQTLPFELHTREPSPASIQAVTEFARLTGDYRSLSSVDTQILALVYELEQEGCQGNMDHVRKTPKRTVGIGKVELLNNNNKPKQQQQATDNNNAGESKEEEELEYDVVEDSEEEEEEEEEKSKEQVSFFEEKPTQPPEITTPATTTPAAPKSWAMLVNPKTAASAPAPDIQTAEVSLKASMGQLNINNDGQFSDAEEEDEEEIDNNNNGVQEELQLEFPSLAASIHVPYEGDDNDMEPIEYQQRAEEERKKKATQPVSNSGKLYNSFRGYGKLFQPAPPSTKKVVATVEEEKEKIEAVEETPAAETTQQSRIMGGVNMSGQEVDVEDDGEGWITCSKDIRSLQSTGTLAPPKNPLDGEIAAKGPPLSQRTACATTDFAMQNVLLQMNLELVSVDGVKIRRLKNWVTRCGACFKVYTKHDDDGPHGMKRLFCERCGSDMLQRIAASVDAKTGRLRLHMSKKHKTSTRGTKFSLPKPGTGNRFQGDILLREDQLMMGAWNQKVKIRSGGKAKSASQSMFGQDIAANVGCRAKTMNVDDIAAGFGRRNPNSAKGRERRGKKKRSTEKACGLRRYR
ncbi:20S-pre-rRNA D-site endonuclease NOB1 [Seminavis robusta]|uniref:20S-pre-rRNA D-site endonuclease NOB1 n=1 Tax=Seminavis robusta TaxID=568900 RepID=A0A9N8DYX9_9STRA|nr:20S-pre-rRNA D-site endonuclease NOB1 [Seminavis robusta]|eukprot:Sro400_g135140.1 20S-pre-rRNA D-site endonuclease NOB1 (651) ;mRNA; f:42025-44069